MARAFNAIENCDRNTSIHPFQHETPILDYSITYFPIKNTLDIGYHLILLHMIIMLRQYSIGHIPNKTQYSPVTLSVISTKRCNSPVRGNDVVVLMLSTTEMVEMMIQPLSHAHYVACGISHVVNSHYRSRCYYLATSTKIHYQCCCHETEKEDTPTEGAGHAHQG